MNLLKKLAGLVAVSCATFFLGGSAWAQQEGVNAIEAINVAQQGGDILLKIEMKEAVSGSPVGFSIANPARIALDFLKTANALGRSSQVLNEGDLSGLNVVQVGDRTRVVLNLIKNMNYTTQVEGKSVLVTLSPLTGGTAAAAKAAQFSKETLVGSKHSVKDISFRRGKEGEGRITVDLSDAGTGIDIRQQGSELVVDFLKTSLPDNLRKKLDVTDFATPVTAISTTDKGGNVRMTITPKGLWEHNAYQADNQFVIEVKPIIENPNKLVQGTKIGYQGPRISINYQNGDVRALLRLMAEELGLNAVISESVTGTATLVLKDVPADQVIDIIFQQKGLDMRKNGNVILIAPRDEIATREKLEYESRQQVEDLEPLRTESFQINYQKADAIQKLLTDANQRMLSKRGSAVVDARTNMLFIQDTTARLDDVRKVIAKVDVPVRQVLIEARIVIAEDKFAKNVGVRLGYHDMSPNGYGTVGGQLSDTGAHTGQIADTPVFNDSLSVNMPATPRSGTAGAFSFILYNSSMTKFLNLEISALEADGRGKIVSSPRVVTADQVEALIEQGTELPYQQATSSGATSIQFKKAMLSLKVKPQITPDGKINMMLDVNKDAPDSGLQTSSGIAITTKHVKTEVLVENGGTVVIGGIYEQNLKEQTQKVPFFGDLPYVGWAFKTNERIDDKTELLIFITPRIVSESMNLR